MGLLTTSYTRSASRDDAGTYPTVPSNSGNYSQYWAPSNWDVPNRVSMEVSYELSHLSRGPAALHYLTNGWKPKCSYHSAERPAVYGVERKRMEDGRGRGKRTSSSSTAPGDYNADGTNSDLPNVPSYGYTIPHDRNHQLGRNSNLSPIPAMTSGLPTPGYTGVFNLLADFTAPSTLPGEGNEVIGGYRSPGMPTLTSRVLKNNPIREGMNLELRLEIYNLFNRPSLGGISGSTNSSSVWQGNQPVLRPVPATWVRSYSSDGYD